MRLIIRCDKCRLFLDHHVKVCKCGNRIPKLKMFHVEYHLNGKRKRKKLCHDYETALKAMLKLEIAITEEKYDIVKKTSSTFRNICDWYLDLAETKSKRTYDQLRGTLHRLSVIFGDLTVNGGFREAFSEYIKTRAESKSPATINRELSIAKSMLDSAVSYEKIVKNPLLPIKSLREDNERIVDVKKEDLYKLFVACDLRIKDAVIFASYHLMRWSEIYGILAQDINLDTGTISISQKIGKGGKSRVSILNPDMIHFVKEIMPDNPDSPLFKNVPRSTFAQYFKKARIQAGLSDLHFHDLRHFAANEMKKSGYKVEDIMKWAGWSSMDMFFRYTHAVNN